MVKGVVVGIYFILGAYKDAATQLQDATNRNETVFLSRAFLAASYNRLGRQGDAEWEIEQLNVMRPGNTLSPWQTHFPLKMKNTSMSFWKTCG